MCIFFNLVLATTRNCLDVLFPPFLGGAYALWDSQTKEGFYATKIHSLPSLPYILEQLKLIADETTLYKKARGCEVKPEISPPLEVIIESLYLSATLSAPHRYGILW